MADVKREKAPRDPVIIVRGQDRYHIDFNGHYLWRVQDRGREEKHLTPKAWDVLQYLANRHNTLVRKDELLNAVWGNTSVTEASLGKIIRELRLALDDNSDNAAFIETVHGDGYRFIAEKEAQGDGGGGSNPVPIGGEAAKPTSPQDNQIPQPRAQPTKPPGSNKSRYKHFFLAGCGVGNKMALMPFANDVEAQRGLAEFFDSVEQAGLNDSVAFRKIARVKELDGNWGRDQNWKKEIALGYLDGMNTMPDVARAVGTDGEYAWFNLGHLIYHAPTVLTLDTDDADHLDPVLDALEMAADNPELPIKVRQKIIHYVSVIRETRDAKVVMGEANSLCKAIFLFLTHASVQPVPLPASDDPALCNSARKCAGP